ncbi:MAG: PAS domain-containing protein [Deltaproteobacteria bacterium]|nr:PAS domain-containing protein [Deltaproteobacteria bacterium]
MNDTGILFVGHFQRIAQELKREMALPMFTSPAWRTQGMAQKKNIGVIVSDNLSDLERSKEDHPEWVRIYVMETLDIDHVQQAINRAEVFRFVKTAKDLHHLEEALHQAVSHFQLVSKHTTLLHNLRNQNKKLEKVTETLERQIKIRSEKLNHIQTELNKTQQYLQSVNTLLSEMNASVTREDLELRLNHMLKELLPIVSVRLVLGASKEMLAELKHMHVQKVVVPLIYRKKTVGHLYFLCRDDVASKQLIHEAGLLKQIADTVALTIEKIKIFEESVKRKEEWQKTFDAIKDPVALVGPSYQIIRANLSYSLVSGMKIQNLVGKKCYEVFQKRSEPCEGCLLKQALVREIPQNFELKSKAQETFYATSSFPIQSQEETGVVQYYRDQGEERRLRYQLIEAEKMAEMGILAGSVAHEINNPLGGILAFSQILLSEVSPTDAIAEDIKEIERAAVKAKNIVENLLVFSRVSQKEDQHSLAIEEVVEKALSLAMLNLKHYAIDIQKTYEPVPKVHGDFNQLVQVFLNIFQNSIQAILEKKIPKPMTGKIEIRIYSQASSGQVVVDIQDNGKGISKEHLSQIFDPFFTTKNKIEHPGMGLSVSYQIIRQLGGAIKVDSDLGVGSNFKIMLRASMVLLTRLKAP